MTTDGFRLTAVLSTHVREGSGAGARSAVGVRSPSDVLRDEAVAAAMDATSREAGCGSSEVASSGSSSNALTEVLASTAAPRPSCAGASSAWGQATPLSIGSFSSSGAVGSSVRGCAMAGCGASSGRGATPASRSISCGPSGCTCSVIASSAGGVRVKKSSKSGSGANSGRGASSGSGVNPGSSPNSGKSGVSANGSPSRPSEGREGASSSGLRGKSSLLMRRFYHATAPGVRSRQ